MKPKFKRVSRTNLVVDIPLHLVPKITQIKPKFKRVSQTNLNFSSGNTSTPGLSSGISCITLVTMAVGLLP
jgi:hypothetical protein